MWAARATTENARRSLLRVRGAVFLAVALGVFEPTVAVMGAEMGPVDAPESSSDDAESAKPDELSPEEIRERRRYRSESSARRALDFPRYILELPWVPVRAFLDYSEGTDLFRRVEDLFYFNEERTIGWFPKIEVGGELGSGGGFSLFHHDVLDAQHQADLSFLYAEQNGYDVRAAYKAPGPDAGDWALGFRAGVLRDPDVEVYVGRGSSGDLTLGVDSDEDDETSYSFRSFEGQLRAERELPSGLDLALFLRGEVAEAGLRSASSPLVAELSGVDEQIGMVGGGLALDFDRRDDDVRPFSGWMLRSAFEAAGAPDETDRGERFGHYGYSVDAEVVIPIYRPHRVLDLRVHLERVEAWSGTEVAFYQLPVLDLNHRLRSFPRNRFRDRGVLLGNLEYRYPIWKTWDAFLFLDSGETFAHYADIDASELRHSAGGGIRFMSADRLLFLFQVGTGNEGTEIGFTLGQVF